MELPYSLKAKTIAAEHASRKILGRVTVACARRSAWSLLVFMLFSVTQIHVAFCGISPRCFSVIRACDQYSNNSGFWRLVRKSTVPSWNMSEQAATAANSDSVSVFERDIRLRTTVAQITTSRCSSSVE